MAFQYYYKLNSDLVDAANVAWTATFWWTATYTPTINWSGANFNANTKYIYTPTVSGSASWLTYSFWIWFSTTYSASGQKRLVSLYPTASANAALNYINPNVLQRWSTVSDAIAPAWFNDWKLHRAIATRESGVGKKLYVDGVLQWTWWSSLYETVSGLSIYYNWYDTSTAQKFTDYVCDEAFFDNDLWTVARVKNDYAYYKWFF